MTNLPADRQSAVRPRRAKHELSAVTATALGEHLGLSRQRISALADEGVIERLPDGQFNQDRARLGYLAWLRDPARRSARSEAASDLEKAKAALVWLRVRDGRIERCRLRDPSWFQWPLLEAAVENNIVADFPLCNKSFNCSYSGVDL